MTLTNNGVPDKIVNMIDMTLKNVMAKINEGLINIDSGVRLYQQHCSIFIVYEVVKDKL